LLLLYYKVDPLCRAALNIVQQIQEKSTEVEFGQNLKRNYIFAQQSEMNEHTRIILDYVKKTVQFIYSAKVTSWL